MDTSRVRKECACPITRLLDLLSGRWALPVLFHLHRANGPIRFGQLQRSIGRVTQKELTRTLREFETRGLVERKVFAEVPPRVEYQVTELGASLREPLAALAHWSEQHADVFERDRPEDCDEQERNAGLAELTLSGTYSRPEPASQS